MYALLTYYFAILLSLQISAVQNWVKLRVMKYFFSFFLAEELSDLHHHFSLQGVQEEFPRVIFQAHHQGLRRLHPLLSTPTSQYLHFLTLLPG